MNEDVIRAIDAIKSIKNHVSLGEDGLFRIDQDKKRQGAYDDFFEDISVRFGSDPRFRGKPKELSHDILRQARVGEDFIWGYRYKNGTSGETELLILPRLELAEIEGAFYEIRHTHREFISNKESGGLLAAGTYLDGQFNFRTGHLEVHQASGEKRAALRSEVDPLFQRALEPKKPYDVSTWPTRQLDYAKTLNVKTGGGVSDPSSGSGGSGSSD